MESSKQTFINNYDYDDMENFNPSKNKIVHFKNKTITALHFKLSYIFMFFN